MAGLTNDTYFSLVRDDNFAGDGKTQPGAAFIGPGNAIETVEDVFLVFRRYSRPPGP